MNIRNKPCNCGSNKKYKNCCWNPRDLSAAWNKQKKEFELKRLKEEEERLKKKAEREKLYPGANNVNNNSPRRRTNGTFMLMLSFAVSMDMRNYRF